MAVRNRDFNSRIDKEIQPNIDEILKLLSILDLSSNDLQNSDILDSIKTILSMIKDLQTILIYENMELKEEIKRNKNLASKIIGL